MITNVSWAANQHVRVIFEGSCDPEDWSNDAEYSALPSQENLYLKIHSNTNSHANNISQYYYFNVISYNIKKSSPAEEASVKIFKKKS